MYMEKMHKFVEDKNVKLHGNFRKKLQINERKTDRNRGRGGEEWVDFNS